MDKDVSRIIWPSPYFILEGRRPEPKVVIPKDREPDVDIVINDLPPSVNRISHDKWQSHTTKTKKWTAASKAGYKKEGLVASSFLQKYGKFPDKPFKKAVGLVIFYWPYKRDDVNWAYSRKWIEDALQNIGLIENDKPDVWECQLELVSNCKKTDKKTIIRVWQIE